MADTDTSPLGGTGIDNAAAAFERMLAPEPARDPDDEAPEQQNAEADEAEALEANASEETPDDADNDAAEDGAEDEADADADEPEQLELPLDALIPVKVDGKETQVPLSEAIAGYQRQADYSRKTMELAEHRRAFLAEVDAVRTERAQYAALLSVLEQQAVEALAPYAEPDWEKLKAEDPLEFAIQREEWRGQQERLQAMQAEQYRLAQMRSMEEQQSIASVVETERARLAETLPQARDPKAWDAARKQLREYGVKAGYSEEELSQAYDHRAIVTLWKAMQWDQMAQKQKQASRPTAAVQGRPKPVSPGSANAPPRRVTEVTRAKQRLAQTGRVSDAASVFEKLL
jgi:hypothetical protein